MRALVIHRYVNKAPAMASCAGCHHKFFTPNTYFDDAFGAEQYLRGKFDLHKCPEEASVKPKGLTSWRAH